MITGTTMTTFSTITTTATATTTIQNTITTKLCYMVLVVYIAQLFIVMFIVETSMPAKAMPTIPSSGNRSFAFKRYCSSALIDVIRIICDGQSDILLQQYPNNESLTDNSNLRSLKRLIGDDSTFSTFYMMCFQKTVPEYGALRYYTLLTVALIMITILIDNVRAQPLSTREPGPNRRYCSQSLFEAIRIICDGRYNSLGKKYPDSFGNFRTSTLKRLLPDDDVMYRPSYTGASNECCRRPCGYAELSSYCA